MKLPKMFWIGAAFGLSIMLLIAASGSGTINTIAKWTGSTALGNSTITDDGFGNITIGPAGAPIIEVTTPNNPSGDGTDVLIISGFSDASNGRGGDITIGAANGNGTGRGGNVLIGAGTGDAPGNVDIIAVSDGGQITLTAASDGLITFAAPAVTSRGSITVEGGVSVSDTITFSSGDSPPANALTPVAWKTVRIGTNEYRCPLFQ